MRRCYLVLRVRVKVSGRVSGKVRRSSRGRVTVSGKCGGRSERLRLVQKGRG